MSVVALSSEDFEKVVLSSDLVFMDFWASWCAPCMSFAPVYEKVAEEYPQIIFTKVNIETEKELADLFSIQSIPHLMIFKKGVVIYSESGSVPKSTLKELAEQAMAVDIDKNGG